MNKVRKYGLQLVYCHDCGEESILGYGIEKCPECGSENVEVIGRKERLNND